MWQPEKSKMSDSEKKIIKHRVELLNKKKREITSELQNLEAILNRKPLPKRLKMPDMTSDITNWRPDLDQRYQKLVNENLNMRFNQLAMKPKRQARKPKLAAKKRQVRKPEMPDLTKFNLRPDIDEKYNKIMESWNQMIKPKPKPMTKSQKTKVRKIESYKDLTMKEVEKRLNNYMNNPKDPKILKNIIEFVKKFDGKEDDYELKRGEFIISKNVNDFDIRYPIKVPYSKIPIKKLYSQNNDGEDIIEKLYQIDTGLIVWNTKSEPEFIGNMDPNNFK